jgi:ubiquinone/menaquinone biosynthesis C-methylase UbiE
METLSKYKDKIREENLFRPRWYSVFINPYFINRYTLYRTIHNFSAALEPHIKILDVGCGIKPYKKLFSDSEYTGIDIRGGGHADTEKTVDAYYDGTHIPFKNETFDVIICTQVLEHAVDAETLIAECSRVLKPNGSLFLTMPFIYHEHEIPYDFRRFTRYGHMQICEKNHLQIENIIKTTGFCGTFAQLFCATLFEALPFKSIIFKILITFIIFSPIQIIGMLLDFITRKYGPTMDYVTIARK